MILVKRDRVETFARILASSNLRINNLAAWRRSYFLPMQINFARICPETRGSPCLVEKEVCSTRRFSSSEHFVRRSAVGNEDRKRDWERAREREREREGERERKGAREDLAKFRLRG